MQVQNMFVFTLTYTEDSSRKLNKKHMFLHYQFNIKIPSIHPSYQVLVNTKLSQFTISIYRLKSSVINFKYIPL